MGKVFDVECTLYKATVLALSNSGVQMIHVIGVAVFELFIFFFHTFIKIFKFSKDRDTKVPSFIPWLIKYLLLILLRFSLVPIKEREREHRFDNKRIFDEE